MFLTFSRHKTEEKESKLHESEMAHSLFIHWKIKFVTTS